MDEEQEKSIFRKSALDTLATPDRLDQLVTLTNPTRWAALFAIMGLIFIVTLWGIFGTLPQRVNGIAVLVENGGIVDVTPNSSGQVIDISVVDGDTVSAGQVLARIDQSSLQGQIFILRKQEEALIAKTTTITQMMAIIQRNLDTMHDQVAKLLTAELGLAQVGVVTMATIIDTEEKVTSLVGELNNLTIQKIDAENSLSDTGRQLLVLMQQYLYHSTVVAPSSGHIVEVKVNQGDFVDPKTPIVSIEPINKDLQYMQAFIYVSEQDGKKLKPGMTVNIAPSTVKREEYGTVIATVTYVSPYPATAEGIMKNFQNESLTKEILAHGAVFEVTATLIPDAKTFSGYKWTSPGGPPTAIQSGTIGSAEITYRRVHPITLILPIVARETAAPVQQREAQ